MVYVRYPDSKTNRETSFPFHSLPHHRQKPVSRSSSNNGTAAHHPGCVYYCHAPSWSDTHLSSLPLLSSLLLNSDARMALSNDSTTTSIKIQDEVLDPQHFYHLLYQPALSLCYSAVDIDDFDIGAAAAATTIPVSIVPPTAAPVAASTPPAAPPVVPAAR